MTTAFWHDGTTETYGIKGRSSGVWRAEGFSNDSRHVSEGDMFVALGGQNTDGHAFLGDAYKNGARCAMVTHLPADAPSTMVYFVVDDCRATLRAMADVVRRQTQARLCAVTGSVGKTTSKEFIADALAAYGQTYRSRGNWNNDLGVDMALAALPPQAAYGVFELGMNHRGEIRALSACVRPHIAVITRISDAHSAHFSDMMDICLAKAEIFEAMQQQDDTVAVLWRDDPFYDILVKQAHHAGVKRFVSFGRHRDADLRLCSSQRDLEAGHLVVVVDDVSYQLSLPMLGEAHMWSVMTALAVVHACGLALETALEVVPHCRPYGGRGNRVVLPVPAAAGGHFLLIDESYNASPTSMRLALQELARLSVSGRQLAVLGDMLELKNAEERHKQLADDIATLSLDGVYAIGALMKAVYATLPTTMRMGWFDDVDALSQKLCGDIRNGDAVMVKGSAGMALRRVCSALRALEG